VLSGELINGLQRGDHGIRHPVKIAKQNREKKIAKILYIF